VVSKIGLYGRYVLIMAVPSNWMMLERIFIHGKSRIISLGEVLGSKLNANDLGAIPSIELHFIFERLASPHQQNGNFDVLNIKIETNKPPVEGFNEAWPSFSIF